MKRYRVLVHDFDSRAILLSREINEDWEPWRKENWLENKTRVKEGLLAEYGVLGSFQKIRNFTDLGPSPFSVVAFHNKFFHHVRSAFVIGAYYPALTGACALGERILNQLILHLREDFRGSKEYKKVYDKESFDNWDLAIDTLDSWNVLLPQAVASFRNLRNIRHRSIHFNPETDKNDRSMALEAIRVLSSVIEAQFAGSGPLPWYIPNTLGAAFVKKSAESLPFVSRIILPNCQYVGYLHHLDYKNNQWIVIDDNEYEDREVTDEEFAEIFNNRKSRR